MCLHIVLAAAFSLIPAIFIGGLFGTGAGSATGNAIRGLGATFFVWIGLTVVISIIALKKSAAQQALKKEDRYDGPIYDAEKPGDGKIEQECDG